MKKSTNTYFLALLTIFWVIVATVVSAEPKSWEAWEARTATGTEFHSTELNGKVVLVSVWGSWSPACRKQMPVLDGLQHSHGDKQLRILAFSLDRSEKIHETFVADHQIRVPSIYARSGAGLKVVRMLQRAAGTLEAVPTVLIYDKQGRLAHRLVGFFNRKQLEELITPLL